MVDILEQYNSNKEISNSVNDFLENTKTIFSTETQKLLKNSPDFTKQFEQISNEHGENGKKLLILSLFNQPKEAIYNLLSSKQLPEIIKKYLKNDDDLLLPDGTNSWIIRNTLENKIHSQENKINSEKNKLNSEENKLNTSKNKLYNEQNISQKQENFIEKVEIKNEIIQKEKIKLDSHLEKHKELVTESEIEKTEKEFSTDQQEKIKQSGLSLKDFATYQLLYEKKDQINDSTEKEEISKSFESIKKEIFWKEQSNEKNKLPILQTNESLKNLNQSPYLQSLKKENENINKYLSQDPILPNTLLKNSTLKNFLRNGPEGSLENKPINEKDTNPDSVFLLGIQEKVTAQLNEQTKLLALRSFLENITHQMGSNNAETIKLDTKTIKIDPKTGLFSTNFELNGTQWRVSIDNKWSLTMSTFDAQPDKKFSIPMHSIKSFENIPLNQKGWLIQETLKDSQVFREKNFDGTPDYETMGKNITSSIKETFENKFQDEAKKLMELPAENFGTKKASELLAHNLEKISAEKIITDQFKPQSELPNTNPFSTSFLYKKMMSNTLDFNTSKENQQMVNAFQKLQKFTSEQKNLVEDHPAKNLLKSFANDENLPSFPHQNKFMEFLNLFTTKDPLKPSEKIIDTSKLVSFTNSLEWDNHKSLDKSSLSPDLQKKEKEIRGSLAYASLKTREINEQSTKRGPAKNEEERLEKNLATV